MGKKMFKKLTAWLVTLAMVLTMVPVIKAEKTTEPALLRIHGNPAECNNDGQIIYKDGDKISGFIEVYISTSDPQSQSLLKGYTESPMEGFESEKYYRYQLPTNNTEYDIEEVEIRLYPSEGYNAKCQVFTEYPSTSDNKDYKMDGDPVVLARINEGKEDEFLSYKFGKGKEGKDLITDLQKLVFQVDFRVNGSEGGEGGDNPGPVVENGTFAFNCRDNSGKAFIYCYLKDEVEGEVSTESVDVQTCTEEERCDQYEPINVSDMTTKGKVEVNIEPNDGYEIDRGRGVTLRVDGTTKDECRDNDLVLDDYGVFKKEYSLDLANFSDNTSPKDHSYELEFGLTRQQLLIIGDDVVVRGNQKVDNSDKYKGITVDGGNGNICMEDCIFPDEEDELYIYSRGSIEMKGDISFNKMTLAENSAIEIWGRGKGSVETDEGFAHLYLNDGIVGEGDGAERICFRDALMLNIGQTLNEDKKVSHSNALAAIFTV